MSYYNFDGNKIFFEVKGKGKPLLMLHGNTASSKMLEEEANFYAKYFKVILVDLIGHGKSQKLNKFPTDYWCYNAQMIAQLCQHLKVEKSNVLGTSGGAVVGLNIAIDFPQMVDKVIADSFAGETITEEEAYRIKMSREISKSLGGNVFWESMHGLDWEKVVQADSNMLVDFSVEIGNYFHYRLSMIKSPVLLTGSLQDDLIKNIESKLCNVARRIKNATVVFSSFGTHPLMISNRNFFRELAIKFFNEEVFKS